MRVVLLRHQNKTFAFLWTSGLAFDTFVTEREARRQALTVVPIRPHNHRQSEMMNYERFLAESFSTHHSSRKFSVYLMEVTFMAARKVVDCRLFPSENNCTLTIAGTEDEVLKAAVEHAVSS